MKIIDSEITILDSIDGDRILKRIEKAARTCYKSEDKIKDDSHIKLVSNLIKRGHTAMLEFASVTVRIICDRAIANEIVRHRVGTSYAQESTRYVRYNDITVVSPLPFEWGDDESDERHNVWVKAMLDAEEAYKKLINLDCSPQEARGVLPLSLKTEIVVGMNLRAWRHFFELRCDIAAHPQIREIAINILKQFKEKIPVVFDDIEVK